MPNRPKTLSFEDYDSKMTEYEAAVRKLGGELQYLLPGHPLRQQLKELVDEFKQIPKNTLETYLKKRHKKMFGSQSTKRFKSIGE